MNELIHGHQYTIRLFYWVRDISCIYLKEYTNLFGEYYKDCFLSDSGEVFEISEVESWG